MPRVKALSPDGIAKLKQFVKIRISVANMSEILGISQQVVMSYRRNLFPNGYPKPPSKQQITPELNNQIQDILSTEYVDTKVEYEDYTDSAIAGFDDPIYEAKRKITDPYTNEFKTKMLNRFNTSLISKSLFCKHYNIDELVFNQWLK